MPVLHAIVLGIVQGLSEFLPISSSGHLEVVPWLLGWDDFAGAPAVERAFDVAVHIGTLVGAVAHFRRDLLRLARAGVGSITSGRWWRSDDGDARQAWLLLLSAVPAAIVGATFAEALETTGEQEWLVGLMLVVFGLVLWWADRLGGHRSVDEWRGRGALTMGLAQALALQPGVSRSGVTITAGRWIGLDRDAAARLSFLMSIPIIAGAGLFSWFDLRQAGGLPEGLAAPFAWAGVASAATGYLAVWATLRLVRTHSFAPFVVYRVVFGTAVILVALTNLR